jgi:hypothetical protein
VVGVALWWGSRGEGCVEGWFVWLEVRGVLHRGRGAGFWREYTGQGRVGGGGGMTHQHSNWILAQY